MDEKKIAQNILIIGLSTIISFIILVWYSWYDSRNFFEYAKLINYLMIFFISLLIGISIALSVRKKGFKAFLWAFGLLFIIINFYYLVNLSKAIDSWYLFGVIATNIFAVIVASIIVLIVNPLIRKFYLKEENKLLKEKTLSKGDII